MPMRVVVAAAICTACVLSGAQAEERTFRGLVLPEVWQGERETVFGTLEFDYGMPTRQSADAVYEGLDGYRATELYLWSLPIVSAAQWRNEMVEHHRISPRMRSFVVGSDQSPNSASDCAT